MISKQNSGRPPYPFRPLLKALAIAAPQVLFMFPMAASAAGTVTASGSYDGSGTDGSTAVATSGVFYVDQVSYNSAMPYSGYARQAAAADGLGNFGGFVNAQVSSAPTYLGIPASSDLSLTYSQSLTNYGRVAREASFTFNIAQLWMSFSPSLNYYPNMAPYPNLMTAGYAINIYENDSATPLWSSTFSVSATDPRHVSTTSSGFDFGFGSMLAADLAESNGELHGAYLSADAYRGNLDLGLLGAGETVSIRYEVDLISEVVGYGGSAAVAFGDPAGLAEGSTDGLSSASLGFVAAPVPEPSSLALSLAGLGALGGVARRRRLSRV